MDQQKRQELVQLKGEILGDVISFVENSQIDPSQKFDLLMASARMSNDPERYRKAYQSLQEIQDSDAKAGALLDLLDAIDIATAEGYDVAESVSAVDTASYPPSDQPAQ